MEHKPTNQLQTQTAAVALAEMLMQATKDYYANAIPADILKSFAQTMCDLLNILTWNTSTGNIVAIIRMATAYAPTTTDSDKDGSEILSTADEIAKINTATMLYADEIEIMAAMCDRKAA